MMPILIATVAVVFIVACCIADARTRRIPNVLSASAMLAGLGLNAAYHGMSGLGLSVGGLLAAGAVLLPAFAVGGIGAGDVKMMGAIGALIGPEPALAGLGLGMILGGVIVVAHLARHGRLREKLGSTWAMVAAASLARSVEPLRAPSKDPNAVALPYSVPLGLGTVAVLMVIAWRGAL
jgi:prepilin peptidase CpaA